MEYIGVPGRGGGLLYISHMGMCRTLGYGFRAVLVWKGYDFDKEHVHLFLLLFWHWSGTFRPLQDLERGMENNIFWSEIGCGTPPPKNLGSTHVPVPPPPPGIGVHFEFNSEAERIQPNQKRSVELSVDLPQPAYTDADVCRWHFRFKTDSGRHEMCLLRFLSVLSSAKNTLSLSSEATWS